MGFIGEERGVEAEGLLLSRLAEYVLRRRVDYIFGFEVGGNLRVVG